MIRKILYLTITIIILLTNTKVQAKNEIYVDLTINEKILTNYDIEKEINYLKILNPKLQELDRKQILQIARNSLINEIIKKDELLKFFNFEKKIAIIDKIYKEFYTNLGYPKENDFKKLLTKQKTYTNDEIKIKMKIEFFWNRLILERYNDQVKIDKEKLLKKINVLENQTAKEYLLFEIVFKKKKGQNFKSLIENINISILENGFENTANIFSISDSSKFGGKVGWVNENNLSEVISSELKNIKEGEITNLINIGNNFLILKVEKIRESEISINKEEELNKMINFETNKQLNQFSKIFFDKSKINYSINEK